MEVEVLAVPENSLIVLRNFHAEAEWLEEFARTLAERIGHDRYLVVIHDTTDGGEIAVAGVEPEALDLIRAALEARP